jgi:uncharacterized protein (DUF2252 family)
MATIPARIKKFNEGLLPDMLQIKYSLMAENAYRFFRGTCHLFYDDLAEAKALPASPRTWVCGDLHLENFGSFRSINRLVYFDLNDFDEALLAPAAWELVRMVTSIFVAFDTLKIEEKKALNMSQLFLKSYAAVLAEGKAYAIQPKIAKGIVKDFLQSADKKKQSAILKKRTIKKKDRLVIMMDDPRHFEIEPFLKRELIHHITEWILNSNEGPYNYEVIDAMFRLAGTGSVGNKRYAFLLRSLRDEDDYILIEMKQATASCLRQHLKIAQPKWDTEAQRITEVQKRMQNIPPALLSTTIFKDEAYIIQEMQPTKDSINFKLLKDRYRDMYQVIDSMGMLTASAQLRSGGRQGSAIADELITFGSDTSWQAKILEYATEYATHVKKQYEQYVAAYKKGYFK